ncbi:transmembrane protein 174 [Anolis carolinensis]|uniref:transmembrane protein 174 n=1 Tax=Anolis carolinensis TaxID=28377 RepID=UPI0001F9CE46|nr:PREDICTED: transmembrane protein 174 [Anolis carolinensis]|eukprot:XP_003216367.1 PREDICTED: transmembrane protein 174 [Anolis carolinensis]
MEQNSNTVEDFSVSVFSITPCQPNSSETSVSDESKAGTTFLFSGFFLGAVGVTFTVMGWVKHEGVLRFAWTQLLGPVLLVVGISFLLIAVVRFKVFECKSWNQSEERGSETNQMASGQSFVFTGISRPITFRGARVVRYIPSYETEGGVSMNSTNFRQLPSHSAPIIPVPCPHYYNVYPPDNTVFSVDENRSAFFTVDSRSERSTSSCEEPQQALDDDPCSDYLPPPYDKVFPPSS